MDLKKFAKLWVCYVFLLFGTFPFNSSLAGINHITPNEFKGNDTERIQQAIKAAQGTTNTVLIPYQNSNGTNKWMIDSAILLPSNMKIILDNCILQLSNSSRDNMFRSDNVGIGVTDPEWNENIKIIGVGDAVLKGADIPRATGDAYRTLVLDPADEQQKGNSRISYGSDAGKKEFKQKGDWRNILVLIAFVKNFKIDNITIKNSHAWAISFERTWHAEVSNIRLENPEEIDVGGKKVRVFNKDGINLRHGCKFFRISDIVGINGDDLIALSSLDVKPFFHSNGDVNSYQVTSTKWDGQHDDTEQIFITNCQTNYTGVAIRASGNAGIHHVYVNGVITKARPDIPPPYGGSPYTLLVGGRGYGTDSEPGKINNLNAMNLIGDGKNLILVEAPVSTCSFSNGLYSGSAPSAITYKIEKDKTTDVSENNLVKTN